MTSLVYKLSGPPSTKLSVRSAVICSTLTEDIVAFSGEWDDGQCSLVRVASQSCNVIKVGFFRRGGEQTQFILRAIPSIITVVDHMTSLNFGRMNYLSIR